MLSNNPNSHSSRKPFISFSNLTACLAIGCLLSLPVSAQTRTWNGSANSFWGNSGNWDEGAFENGANVIFPAGAGNRNNALSGGRAVQSITFKSDALAYRVGTSNNNSGTATSAILTFRNNGVLTVEAGNSSDHSIGRNLSNADVGRISLAGSLTINHNGTGLFSFTRPLTDSGNLTKNGGGELRFTAVNTYSGPTTVNEGTLSLVGGSQASPITVETDGALGLDPASPNTSSSTVNLTNGAVRILGSPEKGEDHLLMTVSGGFTGTPKLAEPDPEFDLELRAGGTELWLVPAVEVATIVIDLGEGTEIEGDTFITSGPINLPLPDDLPAGSILTKIEVNTTLTETDNNNLASDLAVLLDPTPDTPGDDFILAITNGNLKFGAGLTLGWPGSANGGIDTDLIDTKTTADWDSLGLIDLATTGLFLGNAYNVDPDTPGQGGTWSGTITLTYLVPAVDAGYAAWAEANAGGQGPELDFDGDGVANGIEFFLNAGPGFTALPTLDASNTITWTNGGNIPASAYGAQFVIQTSGNLVDWTDVPVGELNTNTDGPGGSLTYTLTGPAPRFVRLKVMPE